jgi:hypothetical protein
MSSEHTSYLNLHRFTARTFPQCDFIPRGHVMILTSPGPGVDVRGTTHAANNSLAGTVLVDEIRAFTGTFGSPPRFVPGKIQNRVVRQSDGRLAFYYRVTELTGDRIESLMVWNFTHSTCPNYDVDFRLDGLGVIGPYRAEPSGSSITFRFAVTRPVSPSELSRFMFIRPDSDISNYDNRASVTVGTERWSATIQNCFRPVWP